MSRKQMDIDERINKYLDKKSKAGHWFFKHNQGMTVMVMRNWQTTHINVRAYLYNKKFGATGLLRKHQACKTKRCVNPKHQKVDTYVWHKLNVKQIRNIRKEWDEFTKRREEYERTRLTYQRLAEEYGVTYQMIGYIISGHSWK